MKEYLRSLVKGKRILILGYGREGRSTLSTLLKVEGYDNLSVADSRFVAEELPAGVSSFCGTDYLKCLNDFDIVFKSPGIVLPEPLDYYRCEFVSQTEIFIRVYRNQIIGITGTKGKSTTSSLLYHVLKESGKKVLFAGNIGIPVFDIADEVEADSVIVVELSCHQLEYAKTSPHRAVILNLYEDHLDHYGTRDRYVASKLNIYLHQEKGDIFYTTEETSAETPGVKGEICLINHDHAPIKDFSEVEGIKLRGRHNLLNVAFVYRICSEMSVDRESFIAALKTFEPLKHRLELALTIDGVDYYDDSISTTVKSTISAVESINNAAILLVGGMERNIDYKELVGYLVKSKLKHIICMYESGKRIYDMYVDAAKDIESAPKALIAKDLEQAVTFSKALAGKNEAVVLSPAAASYGYFKNFEERGDCFVSLVGKA